MFSPLSSVIQGKKNQEILAASADEIVFNVVQRMNLNRVGAVIVTERDRLVGIFTERDVLVRVVGEGRDAKTTIVCDVMTYNPMTAKPATTVESALRLVTTKRFRHLPIVDGTRLVGMVSAGDLTRWVVDAQKLQVDAAVAAVKAAQPVR